MAPKKTTNDGPFEVALAQLIKARDALDFDPVVTDTDFDGGGEVQIGDMTWDHDNASLTVTYRNPEDTPGQKRTFYIDLESYQSTTSGRYGFAGLMEDLLSQIV